MNEQQFRQLLDKYVQGECTPEEVTWLHRFYDSFQRNAGEETDAFDQWVKQEKIRRNIQQRIADQERQHYGRHRMKAATFRRRLKIAASVLLIIGLGYGSYIAYLDMPVPEITWLEKTTQKGQKATLTLTDGTKVYLNVDSRLAFPEHFEADQRTVTLEGEAFFDVARNPLRPFIITSGKLTTTVLGTSFNIKAFEGEPLQVTVATGQVKVNAQHDDGTSQEVLLHPYQQAFYDEALSKKEVDIQKFIAWREKVIQFDEVSLAEAVVVLERWFDVSIEIENESVRRCRISGTYINENLINVLESFKHILDITYRVEGDRTIILAGKGCNQN